MAKRIMALRPGTTFTVDTETERQNVCRVAKILKSSGSIEFDVVTRLDGKVFKVGAI